MYSSEETGMNNCKQVLQLTYLPLGALDCKHTHRTIQAIVEMIKVIFENILPYIQSVR